MNFTKDIYFDGEEVFMDNPTRIIYAGRLVCDEPEYILMHLRIWTSLGQFTRNKAYKRCFWI